MTPPSRDETRVPTALTIAGSDSGGGAGIQADLKAFAAVGVHGASAITCVTSQNTEGVTRVDALPIEALREQIDAVVADLDVRAVKTGMLHTPAVVHAVADAMDAMDVMDAMDGPPPLVVDPVMVATSGDALASGELPEALSRLAGHATLITPNVDELARLTGHDVTDLDTAREAAQALRDEGWQAVLVKGGHLGGERAIDELVLEEGTLELGYPRVEGPFHGAGCTYASLIAALLARGHGLEGACCEARARMHRAIARAYTVGAGPRVLDALEAVAPPVEQDTGQHEHLSVAAWEIAAFLPRALVPEVGINMAHADKDTVEAPADALGLARRMVRTPPGRRLPLTPPGPVVRGGSGHVARVLLAARHADPSLRAAMNLAWSEANVRAAQAAGLTVAAFSRDEEPPEAGSTMEWGTSAALKEHGAAADLVTDEGGHGKEAMMRLVGKDPADLVVKATRIAEKLDAWDA